MTGRTEHTVVGIASRRTLHAAHEVVAKLGERHTAVDDRAAIERLLVLAKGGVGDEALVVEHDPAPAEDQFGRGDPFVAERGLIDLGRVGVGDRRPPARPVGPVVEALGADRTRVFELDLNAGIAPASRRIAHARARGVGDRVLRARVLFDVFGPEPERAVGRAARERRQCRCEIVGTRGRRRQGCDQHHAYAAKGAAAAAAV